MKTKEELLTELVIQWLAISKEDLQAAKILYLANQYRNSYYFFQQAVEKANKALALFVGFTEEELRKEIGHNQLKIFRKQITNQETGVRELVDILASNVWFKCTILIPKDRLIKKCKCDFPDAKGLIIKFVSGGTDTGDAIAF